MRVLALNTASSRLSFALAEGEAGAPFPAVLFWEDIPEPRDQGNHLLRGIADGLAAAGLSFQEIDRMVAVTGPGSFTGIRIGLAVLRGYALAAGSAAAGLDAFRLYAETLPVHTAHRLVVIESWREELYVRLDEDAPLNIPAAACAQLVQEKGIAPDEVTILGDAGERVLPHLPQALLMTARPTAVDLARLAYTREDLFGEALPFYLRPADVTPGRLGKTVAMQKGERT